MRLQISFYQDCFLQQCVKDRGFKVQLPAGLEASLKKHLSSLDLLTTSTHEDITGFVSVGVFHRHSTFVQETLEKVKISQNKLKMLIRTTWEYKRHLFFALIKLYWTLIHYALQTNNLELKKKRFKMNAVIGCNIQKTIFPPYIIFSITYYCKYIFWPLFCCKSNNSLFSEPTLLLHLKWISYASRRSCGVWLWNKIC